MVRDGLRSRVQIFATRAEALEAAKLREQGTLDSAARLG
jgi:hypothetical protein